MMNPLRSNSKGRRRALGLALAFALVAVPGSVVLVGCGGGSGSSAASRTTGKATLTITWPTTTAKLIPAASNSITVAFLNGSTTVGTQTVSRPTTGNTSTVSFGSLPAGSLTLYAAAYPTTGGTGTPQASATQTVTITAGSTASLAISMASTIASLSVSPTSVSVAAGSTTTVVATPKDSSGATVLVGTSTLTYASSNTSVATVNATTGVVTGVVAGSATITATESESGKTAISAVTVTSTSSSGIVDLANAYLTSLGSGTTAYNATLVAASQTAAAKWINLPANPNSDGTQSQRNGVAYSSLTTAQKTAWTNLVSALLASGTAANQFSLIRGADNVLRNTYNASAYSGDYQYIGIVGTPSTTSGWMIQLGGHHNAHNYYYNGNSLQTTTPYFLGTEPTSYTSGSTTVYPMGTQFDASSAFLKSLSTTQLGLAKLSSSFSDVYLGPGKDARSNFPTTGRGALVSSLSLSSTQLGYLKSVIAAWVLGRTTDAYSYQSLYESELSNTYVAYSGNSSAPGTVFTTQGDYLRIDGPHVWIEFVCQNGIVVQNQIHYHSIWRDRVTDYNAAYGF